MVKAVCSNGELDTSKYASPLPIIGVYIAVGSLVCFLSMAFDVLYGFRHRKPWFPCKLFSLNSFIFTVLSVATKIPVDLSGSMPRAVDQLSKLTGTVMLCIVMGFVMPSLGSMRMSDSISNLAALIIVIVTIIVNVCIQIATGVIYAFVVEHAIVMLFMLVLLLLSCSSSLALERQKAQFRFSFNVFKEEENPSEWSLEILKDKLERVYGESYGQNPQFLFCQTSNCGTVAVICALATAIVLEATVRSLYSEDMRFCEGTSDYKWSMWLVVVAQLLTIMVGSFTAAYRWLNLVSHMSLEALNRWKDMFKYQEFWYGGFQLMRVSALPFDQFKSLRNCFWESKEFTVGVFTWMDKGLFLSGQLVEFLCLRMRKFFAQFTEKGERSDALDDQRFILGNDRGVNDWILSLLLGEFKRWEDLNKKEFPNDLIQLLSKTFSSQEPNSLLNDIKGKGSNYYENNILFFNYRVSSLSIVVLAIVATISLPTTLADFLIGSLTDAIGLILFIDKKMNNLDTSDKWRFIFAKSVWDGRDMPSHWIQKEIISPVRKFAAGVARDEAPKDRAVKIIEELRRITTNSKVVHPFMASELVIISKTILSCEYASIAQLSECIEKTFRDMVLEVLIDLPRAILIECYDSPVEELEESARRALKFSYKLELLKGMVAWFWPTKDDITSRLTYRLLSSDTQVHSIIGENASREEGSSSTAVGAQGCDRGDEITEDVGSDERV